MSAERRIYRLQERTADNLHLSVRCPQCTAEPLPVRVEQKFYIAPRNVPVATALLLRTCRGMQPAPYGQVHSVYFDTVDLDQHERSVSGELVKDKVRIRWYGDEHDPQGPFHGRVLPPSPPGQSVEVWLELKSRRGFSSTKQRLAQRVPREQLALNALHRGIVPLSVVLETMAGFGFFPQGLIRPVIVISYLRRRLVEPATGYGVTIDERIRSSLLIPGSSGERKLELPGAVVEVKCTKFEFPASLLPLASIGSSWTRYSKYSACIDSHQADRGSVSRVWPPGVLEREPGPLARVAPKSGGSRPPGRQGTGTGTGGRLV